MLCGCGVRREEWNPEEHCLIVRDVKINQIHIFHTETIGEHRVKSVSFEVAGMVNILGKIKEI